MIRTLLVDVDVPDRDDGSRRWSSQEMSTAMTDALGHPVYVWGEVAASEIDGAFRKLRQLSSETEDDRAKAERVHSAHKALSFFREMFPTKWWKHHRIGYPRVTAGGER